MWSNVGSSQDIASQANPTGNDFCLMACLRAEPNNPRASLASMCCCSELGDPQALECSLLRYSSTSTSLSNYLCSASGKRKTQEHVCLDKHAVKLQVTLCTPTAACKDYHITTRQLVSWKEKLGIRAVSLKTKTESLASLECMPCLSLQTPCTSTTWAVVAGARLG